MISVLDGQTITTQSINHYLVSGWVCVWAGWWKQFCEILTLANPKPRKGPQKQSIALSKRLSAKFAKTANDRNCAFLTTNKKERFAVIWQNNKLKSNFKYSEHLTTGHSKTEQVLVSSIFCFSLKYFVYVFYVHLKNDVFSISLPFPLFQGNTLSLPNVDSF